MAIEAARGAVELFRDGAAFVALAPLKDASLVLPTVAQALGLRDAGALPEPGRHSRDARGVWAAGAGRAALGGRRGAAREDRRAAELHRARQVRAPHIATAREALGEKAFESAWAEGRTLTPERALDAWQGRVPDTSP